VESQSRANRQISAATLRGNRAAQLGQFGRAIGDLNTSFANFRFRQAQGAQIREQNAATRVNPNG
jgi:hypothetical protein